MDKRKSEINDHEKEIRNLQASMEQSFSILGKSLYEGFAKQLKAKNLSEAVKRIQGIIRDTNALSKEVEELQGAAAALEHKQQELQKLTSKKKELDKNIPDVLYALGREAHSQYQKGSVSVKPYEALFAELKTFTEEVSEIDASIHETEKAEQEKPFFKKLADKSQQVFLKGRRMVKERSLPGAYQDLGAALVETDLFKESVPAGFEKPYADYRKIHDELSDLEKEIDSQSREISEIETEIEKRTDNRRAERKVSEIRRQIEQNGKTLEDAYVSLGRVFYEEKPELEKADEKIGAAVEHLDEVHTEIQRHVKEESKLEKSIEYDRLSRMIEDAQNTIQECEQEIEKNQMKIENARNEIERMEKERRKLKGK